MRATHSSMGLGQLLPTQLIASAVTAPQTAQQISAVYQVAMSAKTGVENPYLSPPGSVGAYVMGTGGQFWVKDSSGNLIDCNQVANMLNSACYGVLGGSTGTPVQTDASGNPITDASGNPVIDCSQLENFINGSCSLSDLLNASQLAKWVAVAGVVVLVLLVRR